MTARRTPAKPRTRKPTQADEPAQCCPDHVTAGDCVPHCCDRCPWWVAVVQATALAVGIAARDVYAEMGGAA